MKIREIFSQLLGKWSPRIASRRTDRRRIEGAVCGGLGKQLSIFGAGLDIDRRLELSFPWWTKPLSDGGVTARRFESPTLVEGIATWGDECTVRLRFRENGFGYDARIEQVLGPGRLEGYFQGANYFPQSRKDVISLMNNVSDSREESLDSVGGYIAVQIRRFDYLDSAQAKFYGVVPISFFRDALEELRDRIGNVPTRVLSDDQGLAVSFAAPIENAKAHAQSAEESPLYVLRFLSKAKGLAILNSSFGWWGAFLSGEGSQVIPPKPWSRDPHVNTSDLLEPAWSVLQIASNHSALIEGGT